MTIKLEVEKEEVKIKVKGAVLLVEHRCPYVVRPPYYVIHVQCDAKPTVTFPAAEPHCPLTVMKLFGLVKGSQGCEQLAESHYAAVPQPEVEPVTS